MHKGCLHGTFVNVRIVPPEGKMLSPVRVRAGGYDEALGFTVQGRRPRYYSTGEDALLMTLVL